MSNVNRIMKVNRRNYMKNFFLVVLMVTICSVDVFAQDSSTFVLDNELLVTIIPDIDCPLKIEDAVSVKLDSGRGDILYKVKNSGNKAIKNYTIIKWYSDNTGTITTGVMPSNGKAIEPNGFSGTIPNEPLIVGTDSKKEIKQTGKNIKMIAFVMIAEITFANGSKYSNKILNSLEKHLSKIEKFYYEDN